MEKLTDPDNPDTSETIFPVPEPASEPALTEPIHAPDTGRARVRRELWQDAEIKADDPQAASDGPEMPPKEKNKGGRPQIKPKVDTEPTSNRVARQIPNPRFTRYFSDTRNSYQQANAAFEFWRDLPQWAKDQMSAYVYREYPVLKDPPETPAEGEAKEYKYIDVLAVPPENERALYDMYGSGDYKIFLNTGGDSKNKRTLAEIYLKGPRDFKSMPPSDKRILEMGEDGLPKWLEWNDPKNKPYVEYLRGRGIIPEVANLKQRENEMAQETSMTKMIDNQSKLLEKALAGELGGKQQPAAAVTPAQDPNTIAQLTELRMSVQYLKESLQAAQTKGSSVTEASMLTTALDLAERLNKSNDPTKYLAVIEKLNTSVDELKSQRMEDQVASLRRELAARGSGEGGTPSNPEQRRLSAVMADLKEYKEFLTESGLVPDGGGGGKEEPAWMRLAEVGLPILGNIVGNLTQMFMTSRAVAGAGTVPRPQPQPQPTQPNPAVIPRRLPQTMTHFPPEAPQPQPQAAAPMPDVTNGIPQPQSQPASPMAPNLLDMIQIPLFNLIEDGQDGDDFASWFIDGFGRPVFEQVTSSANVGMLVMAIEGTTELKSKLDGINFGHDQLTTFVKEFLEFNQREYDEKLEKLARDTVDKEGA